MVQPDEKAGGKAEKTEETTQEERPFELRHNCMICGKPGPEKICDHCKIVVQAEAVSKKRKIEKEGG
jgi:hypothetical protein